MIHKKIAMGLMKETYAVCRLPAAERIPEWAVGSRFFSVTKTPEELSVVCEEDRVPENIKCEKGWRILKVEGPLDFSLIGILASISTTLAKKEISLFAVSTYDTDYILVKDKDSEASIKALVEEGYEVRL